MSFFFILCDVLTVHGEKPTIHVVHEVKSINNKYKFKKDANIRKTGKLIHLPVFLIILLLRLRYYLLRLHHVRHLLRYL